MNRLKQLRKAKKMNQTELAKTLHVAQSTLSNWENGGKIDNQTLRQIADFFGVTIDFLLGDTQESDTGAVPKKVGVRIPVLGTIRAGIPVAAIEDIEDWEEIDDALAKTGEFVALRVKGDSMEPQIFDGDIAIIRRQENIESGQVAAIIINGDEATIKKVRLTPDGLMLIGFNASVYEPHTYTHKEIEELPVRIYGRLIEVRRKF